MLRRALINLGLPRWSILNPHEIYVSLSRLKRAINSPQVLEKTNFRPQIELDASRFRLLILLACLSTLLFIITVREYISSGDVCFDLKNGSFKYFPYALYLCKKTHLLPKKWTI